METDEDVTCRLIRAMIAACDGRARAQCQFRCGNCSRFAPDTHIDLGLAIDSPDGLFVPVLRDVATVGSRRLAPANRRRQSEACGAQSETGRIARSDDHFVEFRHHRRAARRACRSCRRKWRSSGVGRIRESGGARRRRALHAPHVAAVAHLRSSRRHRRRGGALSARRHRRSRKAVTERGDCHGGSVSDSPIRSGRREIIHIHRPSLSLKAIVVVDNTACGAAVGGVRMAPRRVRRGVLPSRARDDLEERGGRAAARRRQVGDLRRSADALGGKRTNHPRLCRCHPRHRRLCARARHGNGRAVHGLDQGRNRPRGRLPAASVEFRSTRSAQPDSVLRPASTSRGHSSASTSKARASSVQGFGAVGKHAARFLAEKGADSGGARATRAEHWRIRPASTSRR